MIYLLLTVVCSSTIILLLKHNSTKGGNPLIMFASNYVIAAAIAVIKFMSDSDAIVSYPALGFGAGLGFLFIFTFFVFAKAVETAGSAMASISSRLAIMVPVLIAIILYGEIPGTSQYIGFGVTFLTMLFFYLSLKKGTEKHRKPADYIYLFGLLFLMGIVDSSLKIFGEEFPVEAKPFFIMTIFLFALFYTLSYVLIKKMKFEARTAVRGIALGIPNVLTTIFLLKALSELEAIIVFPVLNIGIILITATAAALIWKEKLNKYAVYALVSGMAAIVLFSI
ncbi:MAG: EamA family transporter [Candidatus Kapabacteria bacterium]|jgi:drug/metabolite transporter (DMT)-like permease|nr:EamA family transporter [Candidatus Kapabacteria bacterium]